MVSGTDAVADRTGAPVGTCVGYVAVTARLRTALGLITRARMNYFGRSNPTQSHQR
jgi:hypothetical protein